MIVTSPIQESYKVHYSQNFRLLKRGKKRISKDYTAA